jgi:hypothetical protein
MKHQIRLLFSLLACMTLPCAVGAQNLQPAPPQQTHPQLAPPNASQPPPEQIAPADRTPGTPRNTPLSDRLSQQQGTLKPPVVDPNIQAPVPPHAQGTMPVIPPPGTPGGDPTVVPK